MKCSDMKLFCGFNNRLFRKRRVHNPQKSFFKQACIGFCELLTRISFAVVSMHKFRSAGYPASEKNHEKRGFPVSKSCFYFYRILLVNIIIERKRRIRGFLLFLSRGEYLRAAFQCMDTGRAPSQPALLRKVPWLYAGFARLGT